MDFKFGRKMNEDVNRNTKLFWKEVSNAKEGKAEENKGWNKGTGKG